MRSASQRLANDSELDRNSIQTEVSTIIYDLSAGLHIRIRERVRAIIGEIETAALKTPNGLPTRRFATMLDPRLRAAETAERLNVVFVLATSQLAQIWYVAASPPRST